MISGTVSWNATLTHTTEFQSTFSENSRFLEFPLGNLETRSKK